MLEREFTSLFDQVMDKDTKVAYWLHIESTFTSALLRGIVRDLFVRKIGVLWLDEPFKVFPLSEPLLKMVA